MWHVTNFITLDSCGFLRVVSEIMRRGGGGITARRTGGAFWRKLILYPTCLFLGCWRQWWLWRFWRFLWWFRRNWLWTLRQLVCCCCCSNHRSAFRFLLQFLRNSIMMLMESQILVGSPGRTKSGNQFFCYWLHWSRLLYMYGRKLWNLWCIYSNMYGLSSWEKIDTKIITWRGIYSWNKIKQ